jgi:GT2 family glycosyltransferase
VNKNYKISASIVLYNTRVEQLKTVVDCYAPSENRFLYLIDNSPVKTDMSSLLAYKDHIYYCCNEKNRGYGAGHNIALKMAVEAQSEYHIIMNPDVLFDPGIIDHIVNYMEHDAGIVELSPKILNSEGETQYLCKLLPTPFNLFFRRFLPQIGMIKSLNNKYVLKKCGYNDILNVPSLSGCFMFLRTNVISKHNLFFDEKYFMYCEDIDFVRRLHKIGKTIYYPKVAITHIHAKESYKSWKMLFEHVKSAIKYFNKWGWFFDEERAIINKKTLRDLERDKMGCTIKYDAGRDIIGLGRSYGRPGI